MAMTSVMKVCLLCSVMILTLAAASAGSTVCSHDSASQEEKTSGLCNHVEHEKEDSVNAADAAACGGDASRSSISSSSSSSNTLDVDDAPRGTDEDNTMDNKGERCEPTTTTKNNAAVAAMDRKKQSTKKKKSTTGTVHPTYTVRKKLEVRDRITTLFRHGYDSYMEHAFPMDELKPLSCKGTNVFGGYSLTLIDALDMLALIGDYTEFMKQVEYIGNHVQFDSDLRVSVFETTIRVVGGLLSGHLMAVKVQNELEEKGEVVNGGSFKYTDQLLVKAVEIADKMIPAFDTPTGIPYNEIHLRKGVDRGRGHTTCPAAAGSLLLEFGVLTALTGNCTYLTVSKRAIEGVWKHRSRHNLVGTMIDILSGSWVNSEASIGASIDSFYEYIFKAYVLFGEEEYLDMWHDAYRAVQKYTYVDGWYLSSSVDSKGPLETTDHKFNSLQAFWPGLQVIAGDVHNALDSYGKMHCVVQELGAMPEYLHLNSFFSGRPEAKKIGAGYPLRPEFLESTYFLYRATGEEQLLTIAERFLDVLEETKQPCGFAAVVDIFSFDFEDKMDSFVLAETFKYLYFIFTPTKSELDYARTQWTRQHQKQQQHQGPTDEEIDESSSASGTFSSSPPSYLHQGNAKLLYDLDEGFLVNTEAHPLPIIPEMHRIHEKCAHHSRRYFTQHNDLGKLRRGFTAFHSGEYEDFSRNIKHTTHERNHRQTCKPVNYMEDVAPFLKKFFHHSAAGTSRTEGGGGGGGKRSSGSSRACYVPPRMSVLGHRKDTQQFAAGKSFFGGGGGGGGRPAPAAGGSELRLDSSEPQIINMPIFIPKDYALGHSKNVLLNLAMTYAGGSLEQLEKAGLQLVLPKVYHHRGIVEIPVPGADHLFMMEHNVFLRPTTPMIGDNNEDVDNGMIVKTVLPPRRHTGEGEDEEEGLDKTTPRRQSDTTKREALMTSAAAFGPGFCLRKKVTQKKSTVETRAAVMFLESDGCPANGEDPQQDSDAWGAHFGTSQAMERFNDLQRQGVPVAVVIMRGNCSFKEKALTAQKLGAAFLIVANPDKSSGLITMADQPEIKEEVKISSLMIRASDISAIIPGFDDEDDERRLGKEENEEGARRERRRSSLVGTVDVGCMYDGIGQYNMLGVSIESKPQLADKFKSKLAIKLAGKNSKDTDEEDDAADDDQDGMELVVQEEEDVGNDDERRQHRHRKKRRIRVRENNKMRQAIKLRNGGILVYRHRLARLLPLIELMGQLQLEEASSLSSSSSSSSSLSVASSPSVKRRGSTHPTAHHPRRHMQQFNKMYGIGGGSDADGSSKESLHNLLECPSNLGDVRERLGVKQGEKKNGRFVSNFQLTAMVLPVASASRSTGDRRSTNTIRIPPSAKITGRQSIALELQSDTFAISFAVTKVKKKRNKMEGPPQNKNHDHQHGEDDYVEDLSTHYHSLPSIPFFGSAHNLQSNDHHHHHHPVTPTEGGDGALETEEEEFFTLAAPSPDAAEPRLESSSPELSAARLRQEQYLSIVGLGQHEEEEVQVEEEEEKGFFFTSTEVHFVLYEAHGFKPPSDMRLPIAQHLAAERRKKRRRRRRAEGEEEEEEGRQKKKNDHHSGGMNNNKIVADDDDEQHEAFTGATTTTPLAGYNVAEVTTFEIPIDHWPCFLEVSELFLQWSLKKGLKEAGLVGVYHAKARNTRMRKRIRRAVMAADTTDPLHADVTEEEEDEVEEAEEGLASSSTKSTMMTTCVIVKQFLFFSSKAYHDDFRVDQYHKLPNGFHDGHVLAEMLERLSLPRRRGSGGGGVRSETEQEVEKASDRMMSFVTDAEDAEEDEASTHHHHHGDSPPREKDMSGSEEEAKASSSSSSGSRISKRRGGGVRGYAVIPPRGAYVFSRGGGGDHHIDVEVDASQLQQLSMPKFG